MRTLIARYFYCCRMTIIREDIGIMNDCLWSKKKRIYFWAWGKDLCLSEKALYCLSGGWVTLSPGRGRPVPTGRGRTLHPVLECNDSPAVECWPIQMQRDCWSGRPTVPHLKFSCTKWSSQLKNRRPFNCIIETTPHAHISVPISLMIWEEQPTVQ
jgi:hypothetical protein